MKAEAHLVSFAPKVKGHRQKLFDRQRRMPLKSGDILDHENPKFALAVAAFQALSADFDTIWTAPAIVTPGPIAAWIGAHIDPLIGGAGVVGRIGGVSRIVSGVCRSYRPGDQSPSDDTGS